MFTLFKVASIDDLVVDGLHGNFPHPLQKKLKKSSTGPLKATNTPETLPKKVPHILLLSSI